MENYKFGSVKLELGVSGYMDILILNTYPARSSPLHDNGMGNTLVRTVRGSLMFPWIIWIILIILIREQIIFNLRPTGVCHHSNEEVRFTAMSSYGH